MIKTSDTILVINNLMEYLKEISNFEIITTTDLSDNQELVYIGDKIVLLLSTVKVPGAQHLVLEELVPNKLFKFNQSEFQRRIDKELDGVVKYLWNYVKYKKFNFERSKELYNIPEVKSAFHTVNFDLETFDELIDLHIIVLEYLENNNKIICATEAISLNSAHSKISSLMLSHTYGIIDKFMFKSGQDYEKVKYAIAVKKHESINYFIKTIKVKETLNFSSYAFKEIINTEEGGNDDYCKIPFTIFKSPWKSEAQMVEILKQAYPKKTILTQYTPYFNNEKDVIRFRYDAFILEDKIAVEYQGIQHFCPVEYFGGEEAYKKGQERDKYKKEKSVKHGIAIVYMNYYENMTVNLIKQKISEAKKLRANSKKN